MGLTPLRRTLVIPRLGIRLTRYERARTSVEILTTYILVRWWLLRLDFPAAVEAARSVPAAPMARPEDATSVAVRLGNAVQSTLQLLPLDARCLIRSLVLTRMLARRGIVSTLILGVRAKPEFAAHAWVEREDVALLPTWPEFHRIAEL